MAGNPFGVDRQFLAEELGFEAISDNSLDTVGSRDAIRMILIKSTHEKQLTWFSLPY